MRPGCALTPQHTHQILTKRPERMRDYIESVISASRHLDIQKVADNLVSRRQQPSGRGWPLPNVWLGTSVEDQATADLRIPELLVAPAAVRFVSMEPLLGPVDLKPWLNPGAFCESCDDGEGYGNHCTANGIPRDEECPWVRAVQIVTEHGPVDESGCPANVTCDVQTLDWIIVGGESGPHARPMHPDWARSIRDQCAAAGVPFLFKQWGEWGPRRSAQQNDLVDARKSLIVRPDGGITSGLMAYGPDAWLLDKVGKARAGRLLDGVEHNGMPGVQHG